MAPMNSLQTLKNIRRKTDFRHRLPFHHIHPGTRIFVLGNGPSLNEDYDKFKDNLQKEDCMCVNRFAEAGLFERIRPKYYILCDPVFCMAETEAMTPRLSGIRHSLFTAIISKLSWKMTLFVPAYARHNLPAELLNHPHFEIKYFNVLSLHYLASDGIKFFLYRHNLACPILMNVMIGALYCSLNLGYEKIILLGADHSWSENLRVDEANHVYIEDPHFNDSGIKAEVEKVYLYKDTEASAYYKVADFFHDLTLTFNIYQDMNKYAGSLGAIVLNASSRSYIDAFERITTL